jgi:hypothetical protein
VKNRVHVTARGLIAALRGKEKRMRTFLSTVVIAVTLITAAPASAAEPATAPKQSSAVDKCQHGVKKSVCTRCNPKLAAVFKAKGDWCPDHDRPESQCVKCHPELAKEGVK